MSQNYYVHTTTDQNGEYEVHTDDCVKLPSILNREYLGLFDNCKKAITKAEEKGYKPADGCWFCCRECHTPDS
jgi:hypothetical protein